MSDTNQSYDQLFESFLSPSPESRPTPLYWWSGGNLEIERMIWHLDLIKEQGLGGTIICYAHRPDGSVDHENPVPFTNEWWDLLKNFVAESAKRGLFVGLCDYQVIGKVLLEAACATQNLNSGNLRNYSETVTGPGVFRRELEGDRVISSRAVSPDGEIQLDSARVDDGTVIWTVPSGTWVLSTVVVESGQIYLSKSEFDPLHPDAGKSVIELFYSRFAKELGEHIGTTFTIFFQDELELGISTPMWNNIVGDRLRASGFDVEQEIHKLWHGNSNSAMTIRGAYRDIVVNLLQEHFFKPIFERHESHYTSLVMDQLSRGDLALGHEHYADFMETMAWYQGPGNDDPDLTAPRNIAAFRTSSSIAHLNGRPLVMNEAFHSSGWGVTPNDIITGLNIDFAAGANQVILHALYYSTQAGWWEWASPDFHFRQPWWAHSKNFWTYVSRVSEILRKGEQVSEIAVLDPTPELDFYSSPKAPAFTEMLMEKLSLSGIGVDLVPQAYLGVAENGDSTQKPKLSARKATYSVAIVPGLDAIRASAYDSLNAFASSGGKVIAIGKYPLRCDTRLFTKEDFSNWHLVEDDVSLIAHLETTFDLDFHVENHSQKIIKTHRRFEGHDVYFIVNAGDKEVESLVYLRSGKNVEKWDAWTGTINAYHSEDWTLRVRR